MGTAGEALATAGALPATMAAAATATAADASPITSRRSSGIEIMRSSGSARQTTASEPSSATFAAYSVIVGAIITPASRPSEIA